MNKNEFKNTDEFDDILTICLNEKIFNVADIMKRFKLTKKKAATIYQEAVWFNDEVFLHGTLYRLYFLEIIPTVARVMSYFHVSYLLAKRIYDFYMENC